MDLNFIEENNRFKKQGKAKQPGENQDNSHHGIILFFYKKGHFN